METIESLFFTVIYINNLLWLTELILFQKGNKEIPLQYTENNKLYYFLLFRHLWANKFW